jgi:hypothetical protein
MLLKDTFQIPGNNEVLFIQMCFFKIYLMIIQDGFNKIERGNFSLRISDGMPPHIHTNLPKIPIFLLRIVLSKTMPIFQLIKHITRDNLLISQFQLCCHDNVQSRGQRVHTLLSTHLSNSNLPPIILLELHNAITLMKCKINNSLGHIHQRVIVPSEPQPAPRAQIHQLSGARRAIG